MIYKFFFFFFIVITCGNDEFHFGILNHQTQWIFLCPNNNTKILQPPSNEQPLISYECPHQSALIEIIPIEIDVTFLCRDQSRFIWIIIDLYQFNSDLWILNYENIQIEVRLNEQIDVKDSKIELKNFTNRLIVIHGFYIPFEALSSIINQTIEITIFIHNHQRSHQCRFLLRDEQLWQTLIDQFCHSIPSTTISIQSSQCYFYSKPIQTIETPRLTTTTAMSNTREIQSNQTNYRLIEENYREILLSLARSNRSTILLKLIIIFLILILIILTLFFFYMLCYHYRIRSRTTSTKNSSNLI